MNFTSNELASFLNAELQGNPQKIITRVASLVDATSTDLSFLTAKRYVKEVKSTNAGLILMSKKLSVPFDNVL